MTATKTVTANQWVVCDDYAAGPFTPDAVGQVLAKYERSICPNKGQHQIVTSDRKPVTVAKLRTMYTAWSEPYDGDPDDDRAYAERAAQTRELAAALLAVGARTHGMITLCGVDGELTVNTGGWSKDAADRADAAAEAGSESWRAALGPYEHATLTDGGGAAITDAWCRCLGREDVVDWVRYEQWTVEGRVGHGFVCPDCRKLVQVG
jgi:hypothetical protein